MKNIDTKTIDKEAIRATTLRELRHLAKEADVLCKRLAGDEPEDRENNLRGAYRRADALDKVVRYLEDLSYHAVLRIVDILADVPDWVRRDLRALARPQVGDGATISFTNDRYAGTVIAVSLSGATVEIQADKAKNTKVWPEQDYAFIRNLDGRTWTARRRADGSYKVVKSTARVTIGPRSEYQAPEI